jgi:hypothetical protein
MRKSATLHLTLLSTRICFKTLLRYQNLYKMMSELHVTCAHPPAACVSPLEWQLLAPHTVSHCISEEMLTAEKSIQIRYSQVWSNDFSFPTFVCVIHVCMFSCMCTHVCGYIHILWSPKVNVRVGDITLLP